MQILPKLARLALASRFACVWHAPCSPRVATASPGGGGVPPASLRQPWHWQRPLALPNGLQA
eukprot:761036-Hanusia_phi.AAC.3